jgi:hypothetical protein
MKKRRRAVSCTWMRRKPLDIGRGRPGVGIRRAVIMRMRMVRGKVMINHRGCNLILKS